MRVGTNTEGRGSSWRGPTNPTVGEGLQVQEEKEKEEW